MPDSKILDQEPWLVRKITRLYEPLLDWALTHRLSVLAVCLMLFLATVIVVPTLDRSFLPSFNEGSLTVGVVSAPGITLDESDALGRQVEESLLGLA